MQVKCIWVAIVQLLFWNTCTMVLQFKNCVFIIIYLGTNNDWYNPSKVVIHSCKNVHLPQKKKSLTEATRFSTAPGSVKKKNQWLALYPWTHIDIVYEMSVARRIWPFFSGIAFFIIQQLPSYWWRHLWI